MNFPVHPHARGEHRAVCPGCEPVIGSSPRTWGTLLCILDCVAPIRFIPTHVGNTIAVAGWTPFHSVHPHARGEHASVICVLPAHVGSSPRTWGTLPSLVKPRRACRFIPTHVGNTHTPIAKTAPQTVHPHARGEHVSFLLLMRLIIGSSPRTWGTQHKLVIWRQASRFIPTHVGNTPSQLCCSAANSVHPHARGEHACAFVALPSISGSSPRTWGTQHKSIRQCERPRFIPTHVGNTWPQVQSGIS